MSGATQQAITQVLQQDSKLWEGLIIKIKQLKQLNKILHAHLDPKLALHCEVANLDQDCLIVITNSAIWATQFRFQAPALLPLLKQHPLLFQLKTLTCKIQPQIPKHQGPELAKPVPMPRLSPETAEMINESAKTIKYSRLQAIMKKIATNI